MLLRTWGRSLASSPLTRFISSSHIFRVESAQKPANDSKKFTRTLLLPKTNFQLWNDIVKSEVRFRKKACDELYHWQWENAKGPLFVLHDGPPYANGDLHMGHALNKILKDIINRFHVSLGRKVHYIPGWDCHGLPIENKALKDLGKNFKDLEPTSIRDAAGKTARREIASQREQFKKLGIMADWNQNTTYRTLDHSYEIRQLRIFQRMVEKGLIYRHYHPVYYSPSSHSALAEAELVYKDDHVSHSVYVSFAVDVHSKEVSPRLQKFISEEDKVSLLVWTTTPWTLTANMGIAVNPNVIYSVLRQESGQVVIIAKERIQALRETIGPVAEIGQVQGSDLIDTTYYPIFSSLNPATNSQRLKIIPAEHVTSESGTGLVHCAPAHGAEDYATFRSLNLLSASPFITTNSSSSPLGNLICHVGDAGEFTSAVSEVVGEDLAIRLVGKEVLKVGGKAIVDILRESGRLLTVERFKHRYPYDWKTDEPVIVTATSQWFANLDNIKDGALEALQQVNFLPTISRNRLETFIRSRSEWCISRQRVWGVPIPSLHHLPSGDAILNSESLDHILTILETKGVEYWWDGPVEEFVSSSLQAKYEGDVGNTWKKGADTMDVWFDSGTSWAMLRDLSDPPSLGSTTSNSRECLADVCLEGSDQHRGWFQSQLLTAIGSASPKDDPTSPFKTLITHGMVLDEKGKKMSKSLGNIVSPMVVINGGEDKKKDPAYGTDTLRLWAATVEYWRDMSIGKTTLDQAAESMRKIRNSARFILGNTAGEEVAKKAERSEMGLAERYVMHELYKLEKVALEGYASYNLPKVINSLTNFTNITLSSLYFDITKDCLYANSVDSVERRSVVAVLKQVLDIITSIIAPVLPHLAEEIHFHSNREGTDVPSVFTKGWEPLGQEWEDLAAEREMNTLLKVRSVVLSLMEHARGKKLLQSSLGAEVDLIIPGDVVGNEELIDLMTREESFLKTLFIVSDASVIDEGSLGTHSPEWLFTDSISLPGCGSDIGVRVRPARLNKCPRCWTFTREDHEEICFRCSLVVS